MTRLQPFIAGIWLAIIALVTATAANAAPTRLVADLSQSHVDITSGYHGTELLLFGAYEGMPGDELVLIVEGPTNDIIQRRKEKRAGVWVNVETLLWKQAPSFYHLFSTAELDEIADPQSRLKADIGPLAGGLKLVAGADGLSSQFGIDHCRAAEVVERVRPTEDLLHGSGDPARVGSERCELVRVVE